MVALMVDVPIGQRIARHQRTAEVRAIRAIAAVSPIRERERRAETRRIARGRRQRARAALLRHMREVLGLPQPNRRRRPPPQRADPNAPIVLSSDSSAEDLTLPKPAPQQPIVLVDLDSSLESLPDIDPRPQFQLPVNRCVRVPSTSRWNSPRLHTTRRSGRLTSYSTTFSFPLCNRSLHCQIYHRGC